MWARWFVEEGVGEIQAMLTAMYAAFNRRDVDGVLGRVTEDVEWPKASEGGSVRGKEAVRAYWQRQWAAFDPTVEPVGMAEVDGGRIEVEVHQVVRDLGGAVLFDGTVWHVYTVRERLIARMELRESGSAFGR